MAKNGQAFLANLRWSRDTLVAVLFFISTRRGRRIPSKTTVSELV